MSHACSLKVIVAASLLPQRPPSSRPYCLNADVALSLLPQRRLRHVLATSTPLPQPPATSTRLLPLPSSSQPLFHLIVGEMFPAGNEDISEELRALTQGPNCVARKYKGFIINGFRFRVKEVEEKRKTQNSGVIVTAKTESYASVRDNNPILGDVTYYGVLNDILELDYLSGKKVTLFNCDWVSQRNGKKENDDGFTLVNFTRLMPTDEPFILASQA
ncbi:uncharacterized protein LOC127812645 [Diospyros lotus]|uniref:uncharacterized protein LOC127812645 n=1 Tax=Diospyros lotus TaxID=55363 RepID=UPI00225121CD|nr:uncharacterized protein LOC127812645 [Diospyros lotus]